MAKFKAGQGAGRAGMLMGLPSLGAGSRGAGGSACPRPAWPPAPQKLLVGRTGGGCPGEQGELLVPGAGRVIGVLVLLGGGVTCWVSD